jgi:PAS domain S-box-containing protein
LRWDDSELDLRRPTGRLGFWEKNLRTGLVQWSSDVDDILGLRPGVPSLERLFHPIRGDEREGVAEALRNSIAQRQQHFQVEYRCLRADGAEVVVRNEWEVKCDDRGEPIQVSGVIQDVTHRKRTRVVLEQQTALLQLLYEIAKCANEAETLDQALRTALGHICTFGGWPFGHVYAVSPDGKDLVPTAVFHSADPQRFEDLCAAREQARHPFADTVVVGRPRWSPDARWISPQPVARAAWSAGLCAALDLPVLVGSRAVAVIQCFSADERAPGAELLKAMAHVAAQLGRVFERKRAEDALRESEARLRQILNSMPIAVLVVDRHGKHYFHNEHALALTRGAGETADNGVSTMSADLEVFQSGTDEAYPDERHPLRRALRGERSVVDDAEIRGGGRRIPLEAWGAPVFDESGGVDYALAAFHDISERKKIERMKDEFVSTVSHELRTPLTSIQGAMGLLEHGVLGPLPDEALEMVRIASESCHRLRRLVDELLDVQKLESERPSLRVEPNQLLPVLEAGLKSERPHAAAGGILLSIVDEAPGATVLADRDRLVQVTTNLLSNAIRYSPRGAEVRIRLSRRGRDVRVSVVDRGPGVPEEFRARLFQKFSQADASDARRKTGTGLGLAICKTILANLGGTIGYEPTPDGGATFHFELPDLRAGS